MRRFLFGALSLGLLSAAFGCHCVCGVCDCDIGRNWCWFPPYGSPAIATEPALVVSPTPLTPMPEPTPSSTPSSTPARALPNQLPKQVLR
jgi:hypothetical protein